ncbi:MAG: 50S ribosomal protein L11 methyltransferase [Steroidobacteraceae bacterium]
MPFLKFELDLGARNPEPFEDAMFAAGATSVTLADAADDPVLEPAPGMTPLWPTVRLEALFNGDTDPVVVLAELQSMLDEPLPGHRFSLLGDRTWEREWLKDFRPMRFGRRLWVCPGGQRPTDAALQEAGIPPVILELDPGLAFGTGTHPTTALCLQWLDSVDLTARTVIDYGCGSGILAVAALKLGAASAIGVDIDPQALTASRENAERNQVTGRLSLLAVDEPLTTQADILLANILAEPLLALASQLKDRVVPGGRIALSGILSSQAAAVAERYVPWFDMNPATQQDGWVRLDGVRRAPAA